MLFVLSLLCLQIRVWTIFDLSAMLCLLFAGDVSCVMICDDVCGLICCCRGCVLCRCVSYGYAMWLAAYCIAMLSVLLRGVMPRAVVVR